MSSGRSASTSISVRFADILFAEVLDPNGQNPKTRRVVVLTPNHALAAGFPIVVAAITSTLPTPLTADYVRLPWMNPPRRHPRTGLTKESAVHCSWVFSITRQDVKGLSGFVPPALMALVDSKTSARAKLLGGWP
ncbi:MAG TPA: type II toxin-antitoxin system PemK/MazF family toxin [Isosphaeraceae bacterium]|nr:type II toxin-antitoxin system PemK/MazF family toxin [Isosphaeraceae bacterium]